MAVEARNLNLNRQLFNPMDYNLITSSKTMYDNINNNNNTLGMIQRVPLVPTKLPTIENANDHLLSFYNNNTTFATHGLQQPVQASKAVGHLPYNPSQQQQQPPLQDDSGVTFNNNIMPPLSRKRSRDNSNLTTATTNVVNNTQSISVGTGATVNNSFSAGSGIINGGNCTGRNSDWYSFLGQDLSVEIMQHQLQLDRLVSLHMEKVRLELQQTRRKQSSKIISAIEQALGKKLSEKEMQIQRTEKLNLALEDKVKSLYLENQFWRDLAQTNEATANELRNNLEHILTSQPLQYDGCGATAPTVEDVASCCGSSGSHDQGGEEDEVNTQQMRWRKVAKTTDIGGNRNIKERAVYNTDGQYNTSYGGGKNEKNNMICKKCGKGESSVLLLPCRHLCLCAACGPTVNNCPICDSIKDGSVHVYLS